MRWGWGCFVNLFASFAAFSGTGGQSYASYYQYAHPYNPYLAPGPSFTVTITQATSTVPTRTTATNSNTAPGGPLPSKAYYGIDGSVCDTRTALAFIGCPCMIVGKACADSSSVCAVPSTGRKKRFAARGRSRASIGGNTCVCKPSYAYDSGSKMCLATATPTSMYQSIFVLLSFGRFLFFEPKTRHKMSPSTLSCVFHVLMKRVKTLATLRGFFLSEKN